MALDSERMGCRHHCLCSSVGTPVIGRYNRLRDGYRSVESSAWLGSGPHRIAVAAHRSASLDRFELAQFKGIVTDLLAGNFDAAWVRIKSLAQKAGLGFVTAFLEGMFKGAGQLLGGVKFLFEQVDKFLPHSDAKMGPLSRLTHAGRALTGTLALGMVAATPTLVRATDDMARSIAVPEIVREVVSPARRSDPVNIQGGNKTTVNVDLQHDNRGRRETIEDWGRHLAEAIYDELERV